jgi:hypothetical protein
LNHSNALEAAFLRNSIPGGPGMRAGRFTALFMRHAMLVTMSDITLFVLGIAHFMSSKKYFHFTKHFLILRIVRRLNFKSSGVPL